ncbi:MAG: hypothetical protein ACSLE0_19665 [Chitinophagaceae bacterium]
MHPNTRVIIERAVRNEQSESILFRHTFLFLVMDFKKFQESLQSGIPPATISDHLKALWYDAKGDWQQSHNIIQEIEDKDAAWIHAYLHRKENDIGNADYWYSRAGKKRPQVSLQREWEIIAQELIGNTK